MKEYSSFESMYDSIRSDSYSQHDLHTHISKHLNLIEWTFEYIHLGMKK